MHSPPCRALKADSAGATQRLQLGVYVEELTRQAEIFNLLFSRAWMRAINPDCNPTDVEVWADLQGALFAAIVVQRTLLPRPGGFRLNERTKSESHKIIIERGRSLRELFSMEEDSHALFEVSEVRDAFEHVDERLDAIVDSAAISISDWHITHGEFLRDLPKEAPVPASERGAAMRVFEPLCGLLHYGGKQIDMFKVDFAMLTLRHVAEGAVASRLEAMSTGPQTYHYGGLALARRRPSAALARVDEWIKQRQAYAPALPVAVDLKQATITNGVWTIQAVSAQ